MKKIQKIEHITKTLSEVIYFNATYTHLFLNFHEIESFVLFTSVALFVKKRKYFDIQHMVICLKLNIYYFIAHCSYTRR